MTYHIKFRFCVFICVSLICLCAPSFYVSLGSWSSPLQFLFDVTVTNLNEPPRDIAASTVARYSVVNKSKQNVVNKSNAGKGGYYVASPPLLNERCTALLSPPPVSEMTYTVSNGTLNSTVPYIKFPISLPLICLNLVPFPICYNLFVN